jgi:hypothetical protein
VQTVDEMIRTVTKASVVPRVRSLRSYWGVALISAQRVATVPELTQAEEKKAAAQLQQRLSTILSASMYGA